MFPDGSSDATKRNRNEKYIKSVCVPVNTTIIHVELTKELKAQDIVHIH